MSEPSWVGPTVATAKVLTAVITVLVIGALAFAAPCSLCLTIPLGGAILANLNHTARAGLRTQAQKMSKGDKLTITIGIGVVLLAALVFFVWMLIAAHNA